MQAIAMAETLRPQVEALYEFVLAAIPNAPVAVAAVVEGIFTAVDDEKKEEEGDKQTRDPRLMRAASCSWLTGPTTTMPSSSSASRASSTSSTLTQ